MDRLRAKSTALTGYLIGLADEWLVPHGFRVASPREPTRAGAGTSACAIPRPTGSARR